ncbi:MAG: hypothetical protein C0501_25445 [Isosphaera sp.]|nr:hypothetical protein [Isosphaera sp.]
MGLSCLCVAYAEYDLFPEVPYIAAAAVAVMAWLYRLEGRVELLSIPEANRVGLIVGLANLGWAGFRVAGELNKPSGPGAGELQMVLVALFGPLLVTLMPAKLARKEKHVGDYWALYGMSLVSAGLSGAMAEDAGGVVLIGLYAAAAVWSLSLFHLRRAGGEVPPVPNRTAPPPVAGAASAAPGRAGVRPAAVLAALAAAAAVPVYLLTPRSPGEKLEFGRPRTEVGYEPDKMANLNQTGTLRVNPAVAFEVEADTAGAPKTDLGPEQRWRGQVRRQYLGGEWRPGDAGPALAPFPRAPAGPWVPPRLGPGECRLTFSVPDPGRARQRGEFLADPVGWAGGEDVPVATLTPEGPEGWDAVYDGRFFPHLTPTPGEPHRYTQVWRPEPDADLGPAVLVDPNDPRLRQLTHNPVPRVKEYADRVVDGMVRAGQLPADYRDPFTRLPARRHHDAIARALTGHLSGSGFRYTLTLKRDRKEMDPVEEFLFHAKAGHCERFAAALVLMLRSQGIPAQLALGFKGCEPADAPGRYVVRQEHAHAWAEALIVEFEPGPRGPVSRWRSLDPSPTATDPADAAGGGWAADTRAWLNGVFKELFVDYSQEQRRRALAAAAGFATRWDVLAGAGLVVGGLVAWRLRRRAAAAEPRRAPTLFDRVLAVLARHGFAPQPGDTPREFAAAVGAALRRDARTAAVAGVPGEWAEAFYESRFGGRPLAPARAAALDAGLADLTRALAGRPVAGPVG